MNAQVLRFHEATVAWPRKARESFVPVRRDRITRRRNWWPDSRSARTSWMAYRLAPRV